MRYMTATVFIGLLCVFVMPSGHADQQYAFLADMLYMYRIPIPEGSADMEVETWATLSPYDSSGGALAVTAQGDELIIPWSRSEPPSASLVYVNVKERNKIREEKCDGVAEFLDDNLEMSKDGEYLLADGVACSAPNDGASCLLIRVKDARLVRSLSFFGWARFFSAARIACQYARENRVVLQKIGSGDESTAITAADCPKDCSLASVVDVAGVSYYIFASMDTGTKAWFEILAQKGGSAPHSLGRVPHRYRCSTPDGMVYFSNNDAGVLMRVDVREPEKLETLGAQESGGLALGDVGMYVGVYPTPDGKHVLVGNYQGRSGFLKLAILDVAKRTWSAVRTLPSGEATNAVFVTTKN